MANILGLVGVLVCVLLTISSQPSSALENEILRSWAEEFGDELWTLGQSATKAEELKSRYKTLNARVQHKDGGTLLHSIIEYVGRMMTMKIDAIKCIMHAAEDHAEEFEYEGYENFSYYSAKHSIVNGRKPVEYLNETIYDPMELAPDRQFYNIPINKSYSSVHVPTNVYDKAERVQRPIQWSEKLDDTFIQNYKSDPALSWQYFGGSSGFLRHYPAMKWNEYPDMYDCRTRFWYIEAATCTKDIVVLMDTTGSMKGMRLNLAKLTVNTILDTFGNNDFFNVFNFSHAAQEVMPCFKDILVQATTENVNTFKQAVEEIEPEGYANFTQAFIQAFQLLEQYREIRGCNNNGSDNENNIQCNQAIMLVTDSVTGNITEVFETYNRLNNGTNIPVRVFTFLVGKEVTKVMEIMWMACLNRGFYTHIHSLAEVREKVFKYIPVIARPLVLQGIQHPIIWTHAFADIRDPKLGMWLWDVMESGIDQKTRLSKHFLNKELYFSQREEDNLYAQRIFKKFREPDKLRFQEYQLMTSVSIPVFNKQLAYESENETDIPDLLGIAGTDVPIKEIEKLTFPYKIGVNGYAFVVTNNGYILLHPDLRPVSRGVLKDNYNSIDLTEIELLDDGRGPRELSPEILQLRESMVNHSEGEMLGLKIKYHYDDMRRVVSEMRDYYFAPLKGTPFTMGLVLPQDYGYNWLKVGDEIRKSILKGKPVANYFKGNNWKVHPKWLYCKYFYESLHLFDSPEMEVRHFLEKMSSRKFRWKEQYEDDEDKSEIENEIDEDYEFSEMMGSYNETVNCAKAKREDDDYYCEKDLMQLLVFDAKITNTTFHEGKWTFENDEEDDLLRLYNTTVRFVSTQSGLTRWQYIMETEDDEDGISEFGDLHSEAIEEPWYKSAILQHQIEPDSYVFSVPFDSGLKDNTLVTASHAIFPRDGGLQAPAAVVGLQFQHSSLYSRFMSITSKTNCPECPESCASEELDCFVLDNNGYVVISETHNHTGRFFGEIEGAVMETMMNAEIFRKIPIFDYQALCFEEIPKLSSAAAFLLTPIRQLQLLVNWVIGQITWLFLETNLHQLLHGDWASANPINMDSPVVIEEYYDSYEYGADLDTSEEEQIDAGDGIENETEIIHEPCDQKSNLYLLQQEPFIIDEHIDLGEHPCSRPFFKRRIPHSNLLLVVVNSMYPTCYRKLSSAPKQLHYNVTQHPCQKLQLNTLPRRRLPGCFTEHPNEYPKHMCGHCIRVQLSVAVLSICWGVVLVGHLIINVH